MQTTQTILAYPLTGVVAGMVSGALLPAMEWKVTVTLPEVEKCDDGNVPSDPELLCRLAELDRAIDANLEKADQRVAENTERLTGKKQL